MVENKLLSRIDAMNGTKLVGLEISTCEHFCDSSMISWVKRCSQVEILNLNNFFVALIVEHSNLAHIKRLWNSLLCSSIFSEIHLITISVSYTVGFVCFCVLFGLVAKQTCIESPAAHKLIV